MVLSGFSRFSVIRAQAFCSLLLSITKIYRFGTAEILSLGTAMPGTTGNHRDCRGPSGTAGDRWGLPETTGECRALQGTAGDCRGLQGTAGDCRGP